MTKDTEALRADGAFCDAVWQALKGDHSDLRKQQIILKAHRAALATPASDVVAGGEALREARSALESALDALEYDTIPIARRAARIKIKAALAALKGPAA